MKQKRLGNRTMNKRLYYGTAAMALIIIEIFIACFVHDSLIRPYGGDILIVGVIYFFVKTIYPKRIPYLPLGIFFFAVGVECLQYIDIVTILGLEEYKFFGVLIGTTFSWMDIVCYGIGSLLLVWYEKYDRFI